jgi:hypothetical protein
VEGRELGAVWCEVELGAVWCEVEQGGWRWCFWYRPNHSVLDPVEFPF